MKVATKRIITFLMVLFMFGYASYSNIIARATIGLSRYILLGGILVLALISNSNKDLLVKLPSKIPPYMLFWLLMAVFAISGITRVTFGSLQIVVCILFAFVCGMNDDWIDIAMKISKFLLFIFVFFTFFFFFFPRLYSTVTSFYGFIPDGTARGAYPYRAGIASHYSINALNISILFVITSVKYLSDNGITFKINKGERFNFLLMVMSAVALLMTAKRGVLVWSVLAVGILYIILNKGKVGNIFKIFIVAMILLGVLNILAENSQVVAKVFERFRVVGTSEDNSSAQRIVMWKLALSYFKENPILGTGFWQYRSLYNESLSSEYSVNGQHTSIDAHNVYIQILCETGIIGFVIYISAVVFLLYRTITLLWTVDKDSSLKNAVALSLALQIFYVLYSFSGNCFYDMTFFYYSFAMAMTYAIENKLKTETKNTTSQRQNKREIYYDSDTVETVREIYYESSNFNIP